MPEFQGSMRVPGQVGSVLRVILEVEGGRLALHAGSDRIGEWPLSRVQVEFDPDGVHLGVEGEDLFVVMADQAGFAEQVRPYTDPPTESWWRSLFRRRPGEPEEHPPVPSPVTAAERVAASPPPVRSPERPARPAPVEEPPDPFEVRVPGPEPVQERVDEPPVGEPPVREPVEEPPDPFEVRVPGPEPVQERVEEPPVGEPPAGEPPAGEPPVREPVEPLASWIPGTATPVRIRSTRYSLGRRPALIVLAGLVVLGVLAPGLLAFLLMVVGGAAVLAGVVAASDPVLGSRFPPALTVTMLLGLGVGAILASALVTILT